MPTYVCGPVPCLCIVALSSPIHVICHTADGRVSDSISAVPLTSVVQQPYICTCTLYYYLLPSPRMAPATTYAAHCTSHDPLQTCPSQPNEASSLKLPSVSRCLDIASIVAARETLEAIGGDDDDAAFRLDGSSSPPLDATPGKMA